MSIPAGWYADGNGQRYWDGAAWTDLRAPGTPVRPWSGISIASFLMGAMSVGLWIVAPVAFIFGGLAVAFGLTGLRAARVHYARGRGLAVWGITLACASMLFWVVAWIVAAAQ